MEDWSLLLPTTYELVLVERTIPGRTSFRTGRPNSKTLYYVSTQDICGSGTWHLRRLRLDPTSGAPIGESEQLTPFDGEMVVWPEVRSPVECYELSPDGATIACLGHDRRGMGLFVVPSQGGKPTRLRRIQSVRIQANVLRWSPDVVNSHDLAPLLLLEILL